MNTFVANFNAEAFWRDASLAKLPSMTDDQGDVVVGVMDELQFPFSKSREDIVLTRVPMNALHVEYLHQVGFQFSNVAAVAEGDVIDVTYFKSNLFEFLYHRSNDTVAPSVRHLSPFAVIPFANQVQVEKGFQNPLPPLSVVQQVNSKVYSHELAMEMFDAVPGVVVHHSDELFSCGRELLEAGPFLIKDAFGVSGKGNIKIESEVFLQRVVKYIKKQEAEGKKTCFLVEPFLDKDIDFSSQFYIREDGAVEMIAAHQFSNTGFAYLGSKQVEPSLRYSLMNQGYFDTMTKVGERLFNEGYFGNVCVDSMMLADKTIVPIVEINARKSMSLISYFVDEHLVKHYGKKSSMVSYSLTIPAHLRYEHLHRQLVVSKVLFDEKSDTGILPLSATTFEVNGVYGKHETGVSYKGKLYVSFVAGREEQHAFLVDALHRCFAELGITVT